MRVLELFCGTKSVSKVWDTYGWEITSVDIVPEFNPTILTDVLTWDYKVFDPGHFDVIWASPPCTTFSPLRKTNIGRGGFTREKYDRDMLNIGIPLLRKTEEIIDYFKPEYFFIENPKTGDMRHHIKYAEYTDVCYCMYGFPYRKATRIWTNSGYRGKYCNHTGRHATTIGCTEGEGWSKFKKYEKYRIPGGLCDEIGQYLKFLTEEIFDV